MIIILLGILIRLCLSLHSYSGKNKPPMYGDYEAQRHWMEITYNLPVQEWYFNSTDNDLMYWGLDYPPLTAYHSYLCGYFAAGINSTFVELYKSRGLESASHKNFMRLSVILADIVTFIPSIVIFFLFNKNVAAQVKLNFVSINETTKLCILLALIYPGIIIIDHGHFQYNCISLGLFVFAVICISNGKHVLSSIMFCLALTYKQMELYHALPFFFFHLGECIRVHKKHGLLRSLFKLLSLFITVIGTFVIVCFPFITNFNQTIQLMTRLFPVARGVFEDKVANVWCLLNVVYKLKLLVSNETMAVVCLMCTSLALIPSCYNVFINNSFVKFQYCLLNSALAFFLFSYQVHEKSILLVAVPAILVLPHDPLASTWFLSLSVFSMLPLLLKDQLLMPFIATSVLFILTFISSSFHKKNKSSDINTNTTSFTFQLFARNINSLFYLSLFGCVILTLIISSMNPPVRYPDIFPLIIYTYSCIHFIGFLVYFNIAQWCSL